jgi:hypothetical protein
VAAAVETWLAVVGAAVSAEEVVAAVAVERTSVSSGEAGA